MFLSRMVNHAIEIIAPHIKSKEEELQEEWRSIKKYYNNICTIKSKGNYKYNILYIFLYYANSLLFF
jgi:hypothetical protein